MTVLFVLLIFGLFIALDLWHERHEARAAGSQPVPIPEVELAPLEPVWIAGYQVPEGLAFHRGHTWTRATSPDTAIVGLDDFARRLLGSADRVELPRAGDWISAGATVAKLGSGAREAALVAPVDGQVFEVNSRLASEPGLALRDPYGRGWLFKVRSSELGRGLRNLLSGSLARRFFEDSREKLQRDLMAVTGTVLADGGEPAPDYAAHLGDEDWQRLVHEHLLS